MAKRDSRALRRFTLVDRVLRAFRGVEGFAPYTFAAYAYSPSVLKDAWDRPGITLSIRYDPEGPSSWIRVHGSPRSTWHRGVVRDLERAGYTTKYRFENETVCLRWLSGKRALLRELRFLECFPPGGSAAPSTITRKRTRPHATPTRSPQLLDVLDAAWNARVAWNECVIGLSRCASPAERDTRAGCGVLVSALV